MLPPSAKLRHFQTLKAISLTSETVKAINMAELRSTTGTEQGVMAPKSYEPRDESIPGTATPKDHSSGKY